MDLQNTGPPLSTVVWMPRKLTQQRGITFAFVLSFAAFSLAQRVSSKTKVDGSNVDQRSLASAMLIYPRGIGAPDSFPGASVSLSFGSLGSEMCTKTVDSTIKHNRIQVNVCVNPFTHNPFTPGSDQRQISSPASPETPHTIRRTWFSITYSDEKWLWPQILATSLIHFFLQKVGRIYFLCLGSNNQLKNLVNSITENRLG